MNFLACFFCLALSACGNLSLVNTDASDIESKPYSVSENLQREVDSLVQPLIIEGRTPGMVVGVLLPDGSSRFFAYGTIDSSLAVKPNEDTLFAIGSLSKGFLGALTELLVDEGVLSWNDTLADLLPGTPLSPDARKITLLQLATHTSGLPRQVFSLETLQQFVGYLFTGESFYRQQDRDYVLAYLAEFKGKPSDTLKYSNIGYGLIGHILELRTGLSVDELLAQKLVARMGLKCTGYAPEQLPCYASRARGHAGDQPKFIHRGQAVPDWEFTPFMRGSAGVYSTAKDLLVFAAAHLKGSETRFDAVLADATRVRFDDPIEAPGVAWVANDVDGKPLTYQIGFVAGFSSYVGFDTEKKIAVVVLQNSFNWTNNTGHKLLARLVHEAREKENRIFAANSAVLANQSSVTLEH